MNQSRAAVRSLESQKRATWGQVWGLALDELPLPFSLLVASLVSLGDAILRGKKIGGRGKGRYWVLWFEGFKGWEVRRDV